MALAATTSGSFTTASAGTCSLSTPPGAPPARRASRPTARATVQRSPRAAAALTVPGAVSGWWEAHRHSRERLGSRIDWKRLFADAITHAREGFTPSPGQRRVTAAAADLFVNDSPHEVKTTLWPIYHPDRLEGGRFVQHDLARTLEAIATDGPEEFYRGALARRIANAAAGVGSPLTFDDFATHGADWGDPIRVPYRGGEVVSLSPPTQGFAALAILALVEGFDVAALDDADYVHVLVEATKLAFEDRDRYLTDPVAVPVPVDRCLDPERLARRRGRIARRAAASVPGGPCEGDTVAIVAADA